MGDMTDQTVKVWSHKLFTAALRTSTSWRLVHIDPDACLCIGLSPVSPVNRLLERMGICPTCNKKMQACFISFESHTTTSAPHA